jgi:hypothetical protein
VPEQSFSDDVSRSVHHDDMHCDEDGVDRDREGERSGRERRALRGKPTESKQDGGAVSLEEDVVHGVAESNTGPCLNNHCADEESGNC